MNVMTTDTLADDDQPPVQAKAKTPLLPDASLLWAVFRRRLWLFLAVAALVTAGIAAWTLQKTPIYAAAATVLIEPQQANVVDNVRAVNAPISGDAAAIETEVQILSSAGLAGRVADALNLQRYPEFGGGAGAMIAEQDRGGGPGMHPLARAVQSKVRINRIGLSYLIGITAESSNRFLAAQIANEYARQYIAQQAEAKNSEVSSVSSELQKRLKDMEGKVLAADRAVQQYKIANNLMSSQGSTLAEQEVSNLGGQIAGARAELASANARLSAARTQLSRGGGGADVGAALGSGTVSGLRQREADTTQRLADLTTRYGDRHPDVQRARQELVDVRAQLQREIDRIISSLSAEQQAAASRLASLSGSQSAAKGSLASNNAAAVGLLELERKADAVRSIYQSFLNRSKETMSQEGLERADARIDSLSRVPLLPFTPNVPLAIAFALVFAPIAGLGAIAVAEYLDGKVSTKQDVEHKLRVRYIGAIPQLESTLDKSRVAEAPADYLLEHPASAFAEAFRSLRTATLLKGRVVPRTVAITSALPREGKSTTSICLARTFVGAGSRTVLVDCDIRRRSTSQEFMPDNWSGLLDFLAGTKPLQEALFKDPYSDLYILGSTVAPSFSRDLFADRPIEDVLAELHQHFEVVVLDTAPVLAIAETRTIAAAADSVVMLARWRSTSMKAADAAVEMLLGAHAKLRGVALNLVDIRRYASTGYQDVYSYHKKFKGYYQN
ncbi:capsular exopolysaccharide family [Sphingomonas guangdongensis]|uniref:non-specific protein-tyrosine kinase n=1 Tax=Sphingomonas guangdongensis TaxID=1141890 RepID=A0A285QGY5_9SPHN|nr:AAA family ATPase [Sphingomonas guangdongensis]SOB81106.1 capsular exopolysaccharide family [Sphingomonas guangdongensis]